MRYNVQSQVEDLLGACWQDQSIDLKGMDVVYCNGEVGLELSSTSENGNKVPNDKVGHYGFGAIPNEITPWNVEQGGAWHAMNKAKAVAKGGLPGATMYENGGSKADKKRLSSTWNLRWRVNWVVAFLGFLWVKK
jgi:hypothetical protein